MSSVSGVNSRGDKVPKHRSDNEWQQRGACRGPQSVAFFPPNSFERKEERDARETKAKSICGMCDVRQPCLEYAIAIKEPNGVWGGMNENERKSYAKSQLAKKSAPVKA